MLLVEETFNIQQQFFIEIANYCQEHIAAQAEIIDQDSAALKKALKALGDRNLLGLKIPQKWQGLGLDEISFRQFQVLITRYSGALAFLQAQHQSAASMLANCTNEKLKKEYLPLMGDGRVLMGIAFSQLRRKQPIIKANPAENGYDLEGEIPWITGFGFFEYFILGAALPNGDLIYGLMPFRDSYQTSGGSIYFSKPLKLAVMESTNTVSAVVEKWLLKPEQILLIKPSNFLQQQDQKNVLDHGFFALGCAQSALDIIEKIYQKKQLDFIHNAEAILSKEYQQCSEAMFTALSNKQSSYEHQLKLRGWSITLAGKCAQAAIAVSSGSANHYTNPAQRVYREALLFTVSGQTTDVMEITLNQLISGSSFAYN